MGIPWGRGPVLGTAVLAAGLTGLLARAAPQKQPKPVFGVDVEMVNVTVTVRDQNGHLISNLRREDFILLDEGQPKEVVVFGHAHKPDDEGDPGDGPGGERKRTRDQVLALDLGLLLDTSQSMLPELKLAQQAATRFLESIPRARELYTVFFDEEIRLSRYDSEHQQGLFERIHELKGGGNTALYDAIAAYVSRIEGGRGRKVVVIFTDGEDTRSSLTQADALAVIRSSAVTFYPVAFTGSNGPSTARGVKARAFLQWVADMSGGQVFQPHASKDLAGIFQKILDELSAQYVLGFVPAPAATEGQYHKLTVRLRRPGLKVRHRAGYYPPAPAAREQPSSPGS